MERRASYMLGLYTIINPHPSTQVPKLSIPDPPPHQENGLLGLLFYTGFLQQETTSYMPLFKLL